MTVARAGCGTCRPGPAGHLGAWRAELLAYFDIGGMPNRPTEAINLLIKKIKRAGHGFRNFDNYRLRLLLHRASIRTLSAPPRSEVDYHA
jgi:hypothetical protein